jgi:hypothetical protein
VDAQFKLFNAWYAEWSRLPGAVQQHRPDPASAPEPFGIEARTLALA